MSQEKSEAQKRNEEAVRRIMAERGYSREPTKRKKRQSKLRKPLITIIAIVLLLSGAITCYFLFKPQGTLKSQENSNNNSSKSTDLDDPDNPTSDDNTDLSSDYDSPYSDDSSSAEDPYKNLNVDYLYTDESGVRHYSDGSTFNPHLCDEIEAKYKSAYDEANRLNDIWTEKIHNYPSFSELYEQAGKNMAVAQMMQEEEQQKIKDAENATKAAYNRAQAIYDDEVVPCQKEELQGSN